MRMLVVAMMLCCEITSAQNADNIRLIELHEKRATWCIKTIPWFLLFGSLLTWQGQKPSNNDDSPMLGPALGAITAFGTVGLTIGYGENKRQARVLREL